MNPLFEYFWPDAAIGLVIGAVGATIFWRRKPGRIGRWLWFDLAIVLVVAGTLVWSGPLGAGHRFIAQVEPAVERTLAAYEMTQVHARLGRAPLNRQVILEGPANDLQRSELVRIIGEVPGVSIATWGYPGGAWPIILEGAIVGLAGFLFGLFLAYLLELHRRYNAQWDW
jgi:hypothetical protein